MRPHLNVLTGGLAERHPRSSTDGRVENPGSHRPQLRLPRSEEKLTHSFWMDAQEPQSRPPRRISDGYSHPTFHASESHHSDPPSPEAGPAPSAPEDLLTRSHQELHPISRDLSITVPERWQDSPLHPQTPSIHFERELHSSTCGTTDNF